jgi:Holliday junction resolvasome, DNA-binding subunit
VVEIREPRSKKITFINIGLADAEERDWFKLLTTEQGVGTKCGFSDHGCPGS